MEEGCDFFFPCVKTRGLEEKLNVFLRVLKHPIRICGREPRVVVWQSRLSTFTSFTKLLPEIERVNLLFSQKYADLIPGCQKTDEFSHRRVKSTDGLVLCNFESPKATSNPSLSILFLKRDKYHIRPPACPVPGQRQHILSKLEA
ncbi:hypothetical protein CVT26_013057 [Gymnopilus dilepis]|uniref:Uncharacterized protein n=1 Tax=Gymnopilus dilepis TaxID=231916 RepID=A0A409Y4G9_9AGAR|nr:hypothetical protein CVT26_013057 [Gymnopilus dilepis]